MALKEQKCGEEQKCEEEVSKILRKVHLAEPLRAAVPAGQGVHTPPFVYCPGSHITNDAQAPPTQLVATAPGGSCKQKWLPGTSLKNPLGHGVHSP